MALVRKASEPQDDSVYQPCWDKAEQCKAQNVRSCVSTSTGPSNFALVCRSSPSCIARRSLGVTTLFIRARRVSFFVRLRRVLQDPAFTKPCEGVHTQTHTSKTERLNVCVSLTLSEDQIASTTLHHSALEKGRICPILRP